MNAIFEDLRTALFSVWHRRWLALAVAWGFCLLGWLAVAMVANSYESRARIFVQLDDALAEQIGIGVNDRKRNIERVRQTLTSAINLEKVVRSTKLGENITTPRAMESTVISLAKDIKVVSQQDNLFEITAVVGSSDLSDAENAKLAQDVVQKLIDIFREENLAGGKGEMTETIDFMNTQLASRQRDLETAEQRRLQFEAAHPEMIQGGAGGLQRLEAARSEQRGIDGDLAAAQSALAAINGQIAGTPATLAATGPAGGARGALGQATADLAGMRARGLTDGHPDVISVKNQINLLRSAAQSETAAGLGGVPNPAYTSLQSMRADRQASLQALTVRRASVQAEVARLTAGQISNPEVAAEHQRINRDYDVLKTQYDKLLQDREQLRLRGQVETERDTVKFQVVDPPTSPRSPVAPNRPILLLAVLVLGLGAGTGVAFAIAQLRSSFATTVKLEKALGLPVLGSISQTLSSAMRSERKRKLKLFYAGAGALAGTFALLLVIELIQVGMVA